MQVFELRINSCVIKFLSNGNQYDFESSFGNLILEARDNDKQDLFKCFVDFFRNKKSLGSISSDIQESLLGLVTCVLLQELSKIFDNQKYMDMLDMFVYHSLPHLSDQKNKSILTIYKIYEVILIENQ